MLYVDVLLFVAVGAVCEWSLCVACCVSCGVCCLRRLMLAVVCGCTLLMVALGCCLLLCDV